MLFLDGGLRIEELLNLRMKDVNYVDTPTGNKLMRADIRYSKTEARNPELLLSQSHVEAWIQTHPNKTDANSYLFLMHGSAKSGNTEHAPLTYGAVRVLFS